mmetsp:Transcript_30720/g.60350  ORF Transcript_30720/g.60350 Transcript_30720/m.60350 type:complete len:914 (+) Transcript_30720:232-2973(+)
MHAELEHDLLSIPGLAQIGTGGVGEPSHLPSKEILSHEGSNIDAFEQDSGEEDCQACCSEGDPVEALHADVCLGTAEEEEEKEEEEEQEQEATPPGEADAAQGGDDKASATEGEASPVSKKRAQTSKARSQSLEGRLAQLAQPRQPRQDSGPEPSETLWKRPPQKKRKSRPALLFRLRPSNLHEAMEAFWASGFREAPQFTYAFPEEEVTTQFKENSNVCFELLPEAKRILQTVHDKYGGPEQFMARLYGDQRISAKELQDTVAQYLAEHNIADKVEIRIVDSMLAAAYVSKSSDDKYVVNIANCPISSSMVQGICDHEVGTHLLRMMNDEHQVWHGHRDRFRLSNPWTTEEGFATLNTYLSMRCKLLYPQALRYFAVCRGAQLGFVELFQELQGHVSDPRECWQMCCRIKRGMMDTSQPGAFYMDQAYFKGAVEILRHLDEIDFGRLYGGQIALQDLDKVHFLMRKDMVKMPRFMSNADKLKTYMSHCRKLIRENQIEAAMERICKPVFLRAARELVRPPKAELRTTVAVGASVLQKSSSSKTLDLARLEDLARPRALPAPSGTSETESAGPRRELDVARLAGFAAPRTRAEDGTSGNGAARSNSVDGPRIVDLARLQDLARPRVLSLEPARLQQEVDAPRREPCPLRLLELARPRASSKDVEQGTTAAGVGEEAAASPKNLRAESRSRKVSLPVILVPAPAVGMADVSPMARPPDMARLAVLAQPRKTSEEEVEAQSTSPRNPRKVPAKKKRSKCRILALAQEKWEQSEDVDGTLGSATDELDDAIVAPASQTEGASPLDAGDPCAGEAKKASDKRRTSRARPLTTAVEASGGTHPQEAEAEAFQPATLRLPSNAPLKASASRRPRMSVRMPRASAVLPCAAVTVAANAASDRFSVSFFLTCRAQQTQGKT